MGFEVENENKMDLWLPSYLSSLSTMRTLRLKDEKDLYMVTWPVTGRAGANTATSWEDKGTQYNNRCDRAAKEKEEYERERLREREF